MRQHNSRTLRRGTQTCLRGTCKRALTALILETQVMNYVFNLAQHEPVHRPTDVLEVTFDNLDPFANVPDDHMHAILETTDAVEQLG